MSSNTVRFLKPVVLRQDHIFFRNPKFSFAAFSSELQSNKPHNFTMLSPDTALSQGLKALHASPPVAAFVSTMAPPPATAGWVALCASIAPMSSMLLSFAPYPTINKVAKDREVGSLPLLPYSSMIANAFLWMTYGILKKQPSIWGTNVIGLLFGLFYFCRFIQFARFSESFPGSIRQHISGCIAVVALAMGIVGLIPTNTAAVVIGNLAVLFCMALFGSPLASLKTVVKTRSAESIPLPFTLATIFNCLMWSVTGIFKMRDVNVYFPNVIGLTFGMAQILLKVFLGGQGSTVDFREAMP